MRITAAILVCIVLGASASMLTTDQVALKDLTVKRLGKAITIISIADCDSTGAPYFTIDKLTITGNVQQGSTLQSTATKTVKQAFAVSQVLVNVYYSSVKVHSETIPVSPPTQYTPGTTTDTMDVPVSIEPPAGKYLVQIKYYDQTSKEIQCVSINASLQ